MKTTHLIVTGVLILCGTATIISRGTISETKFEEKITPAIKKQQPIALAVTKTENPASAKKTEPLGCVFKTAFEGEGIDNEFYYKIPGKVVSTMNKGLEWIEGAQSKDGGWGAGSHHRQNINDPHAVQSDPATTAMVAMAIQRCGSDLNDGPYSNQLKKALLYLVKQVEDAPQNSLNITTLENTQPQTKLGKNIDVVLTSQFLTNIMEDLDHDPELKSRVKKCVKKCVAKIEMAHTSNGSMQGSGWAGVLQSSFATSALESAKNEGIAVDEKILDDSRDYQKGNINTQDNTVETESAAGIVLYSVSGSTRASAKETAEAKDKIKQAKKEGKIKNEEVTVDNLQKAGLSESQAMKYSTAYQINQSSKKLAQDDNVISGFGNNGGEEFLSYLQTGEGMIISKDNEWQSWYDKTSGRLLSIQNEDGSWSGHHCITSPVFCTATCLLILSVNNDIDKLTGN